MNLTVIWLEIKVQFASLPHALLSNESSVHELLHTHLLFGRSDDLNPTDALHRSLSVVTSLGLSMR